MTLNPIWGNGNRTKKSQNLKSLSELMYRMNKLCTLLLVCTLLQKLPDNPPPPRGINWLSPKLNKEINEPSYEMVGVKIKVTHDVQNNRIKDYQLQ
jgi:hypothetical protein